jgi:glucuronoarabinoxylan endo-1,4-beta-xylanase
MKINYADKTSPLLPYKYDDYAKYLQSYVDFMKQNGASLYAISPINEPDFKTQAYNTMPFTTEQLLYFIKNFAKKIHGVKIMAPESFGYDKTMINAIMVYFIIIIRVTDPHAGISKCL